MKNKSFSMSLLVVLILLPSSTRSAPFPSSCADLQAIGHSLDGFYLVKNPTTRKIETIFCDFVTSGKLKTNNITIITVNSLNTTSYVPIKGNFNCYVVKYYLISLICPKTIILFSIFQFPSN